MYVARLGPQKRGVTVDFYTPAYVALVVATVGVMFLPVHLAGYREQGVLRRFRASALPPAILLGAHATVAAATATAGALLLTAVSTISYGATTPRNWPILIVAFLLVTAAFASLGVLLGLLPPTARAAQGLGVLLFFVFMMLGGAGSPQEVLPGALAVIGNLTPLTYAGRALRGPWMGHTWDVGAVLVMTGILAVSVALTAWLQRHKDPT